MSKADDFRATAEAYEKRPTLELPTAHCQYNNAAAVLKVTDTGKLMISLDSNPTDGIASHHAMQLAHWLTKTFGDKS